MMRRRGLLADLLLVMLVVAVSASVVGLLRSPPRASGAAAGPDRPRLRVTVFGDELVGDGPASATEQAAAQSGWALRSVDAAGTGYTAAPAGAPNFAGLVERSLPAGSGQDVVLVQGGRADLAATPGTLAAGVAGTIQRLKAGCRRARGSCSSDRCEQRRTATSAASAQCCAIPPVASESCSWTPSRRGGCRQPGSGPLSDEEQRQVDAAAGRGPGHLGRHRRLARLPVPVGSRSRGRP